MSASPRHRSALAAGAALLTGALVLAGPLAASAHVHVDPARAAAGTAAVDLTFTVPNEEPKASTTAVLFALPASARFTTLAPTAVRGWQISVSAAGVRFDATGAGIGDRQVQSFVIRVGPVPDVGSVPIPVTQTYSDGTVVHWDQRTPPSGEEPEHPAPTLYVRDPAPVDDDDGDVAAAPAVSAAPDGSAGAAVVLASTALAVGVVAVALAAVALVRSRRR